MKIADKDFDLPKELEVLFEIIADHNGQCRLIGGCVRDCLSNKKPLDFDIATDLLPEKIMQIFKCNGHKVVPIGLEHGTVLVIINHHNFEITTLRKDVECFGRHAEVEFTNDWKADASRRDFTINAISISPQGKRYDYFGGQEDLQKRIVKFVGNPFERIQEDYLRIMRFFRFLGYFGLKNIDNASYTAAINNAQNLQYISKERIRHELLKLLGSLYAKDVVIMLNQEQILTHIGFPKNTFLDNERLEKIAFKQDDPMINLAILISISNNQKKEYLDELKGNIALSNKEYKELSKLIAFDVEQQFASFHHYKYWHEYGKELYLRLLFVINSINVIENYERYMNEALNNKEQQFPLTGVDLQQRGYKGKIIGQLLKTAKNHWHAHSNDLTKSELLDFLPH